MFSITFFLGANIPPVVLLFKGEDTAKSAISVFEVIGMTGYATLTDDFGQELRVPRDVIGVFYQDLKQAQEADILRGVHQATTQAKAQERAQSDPFLQTHFRKMQQGPAVLSPMGPGGPRFNG